MQRKRISLEVSFFPISHDIHVTKVPHSSSGGLVGLLESSPVDLRPHNYDLFYVPRILKMFLNFVSAITHK